MSLTKKQKMKYCKGCYNNIYNHGAGGANECWSLSGMKIVWRKPVHKDEVPPWNSRAKRLPSCYHKPGWIFVEPGRKY